MEIDSLMHKCLMTQAEESLANVSCYQAYNMQMMNSLNELRYRQSMERQYNALMEAQQNAWPRIMEAIRGNMGLPKTPDKPIWKETKDYWIVVAHQVGPLKLLEIVLKEGCGDG